MAASGVPELVRAWTYNPKSSNCIYGPIIIIGCEPPECINYKNTNVDPEWWEFIRGICSAWSGSGGYAWPDDVPDCPYPNGIFIEATTCTGGLVYLKIEAEGEGFNFYLDCPYYGYIPFVKTGNAGRGPWGTICNYYWQWGTQGWVSVDCSGNVGFWSGYIGYYYAPSYGGTGTPIALDDEHLPIGSSVIPVWSEGYYSGGMPPVWIPPAFYANLTITVSKL